MKKRHRKQIKIAYEKLVGISIKPYHLKYGYGISGADVIMLGHAQDILRDLLDEPR